MSSLQLVNTSPETIVLPRRTYNHGLVIPGVKRGDKYTSAIIPDSTDYEIHFLEYDFAKAKKIPVPITAQETASDYFGNERLKQRGCFTKPVGEAITEEDIAEAKGQRKAWLEALVQEADEEFSRTHKVDQIPGHCKRACRELGIKREWSVQAPNATVQCEACAGRVELLDSGKPPILCTFCGYPMDKQRAIEEGLWTPPEAKKRMGRPPKSERQAEAS